MRSVVQIMVDAIFETLREGGRRSGIEQALRDAIRDGRLAAGVALPSTRALAAELGVARGTVTEAYSQLAAEGYVLTRPGSLTRVTRAAATVQRLDEGGRQPPAHRFDMRPGSPDPEAFPANDWVAALRRVAKVLPADATAYGDPLGRPELRRALAAYLTRARGLAVDPERVIITSGFTIGLGLVLSALRERGVARIGMEDPCLNFHRDVVLDALDPGGEVLPLEVTEGGVHMEAVEREEPQAVLVTPAHQYPLGMTMTAARRTELLRWADTAGAFVLEDDYDGELRYDRQPVGALQGLAPERVVYLGTASKSMAPGLRIGWVVAPQELVEPLRRRKLFRETVPALDQLALADLIASGWFDRHLRKRRGEYRARRDLFVRTVAEHAPSISVRGVAAGLNAVLELPAVGASEGDVVRAAAARGIALVGLAPLWHPEGRAQRFPGLVVGYGRPRAHDARAAFTALGELLADTVLR